MYLTVVSSINKKMKNRFILLLILTFLAACNAFKPASHSTDNLSDQTTANKFRKKFTTCFHSKYFYRTCRNQPVKTKEPAATAGIIQLKFANSPKTPESAIISDGYDPLQFKYAILTNTPVEELTNPDYSCLLNNGMVLLIIMEEIIRME